MPSPTSGLQERGASGWRRDGPAARQGGGFARRGAPALAEKLAPFLAPGETLPDVGLLVTLLARRLAWLLERLAAAVDADAGAGVALSLARSDRECLRHRLADLLCHLRNFFQGPSNQRPAAHPGLRGPIPTQPDDLLRHARYVLAALQRPAPRLPRWRGVTIDPGKLAAGLQPEADALAVALDHVVAREADALRAGQVKKRARTAFEADCRPASRLLESLSALAGERPRPAETGRGPAEG